MKIVKEFSKNARDIFIGFCQFVGLILFALFIIGLIILDIAANLGFRWGF